MKRAIKMFMVVGLFLSLVPTAYAAETTPVNIMINGETFIGPAGEPAPYANKDQRTLIPIRFFAEKLGVPNDEEHIVWDQETQTATITNGTNTVSIPLGSQEIEVNGETVVMDTAAESKNGRVFIPARFLAEGFGAKVYWEQEDQTALFFTQEFLDNYIGIQTGSFDDVQDLWILPAVYDIHSDRNHIKDYGSYENLKKRLKLAHKVADQINIQIDDQNQQMSVTLPQSPDPKLSVQLAGMKIGTREPGTYTIPYTDINEENGYLFDIGMGDYNTGYGLFNLYGYVKDGKGYFGKGTPAWNQIVGDE